MCTVLLRFDPGGAWPLLLAAVRDEFVDRAWDPPGRHWDDRLVGGRDREAGGTWLAVDPVRPAVAAILNGVRLPPLDEARPTRGTLPLEVLRGTPPEGGRHDGFHLLAGTREQVRVWSWDGVTMLDRSLEPGDHIVVNRGVGMTEEPLVAHFLPMLRTAGAPPAGAAPSGAGAPADAAADLSTVDFWGDWVTLLGGDGLDPTDPRALLVRRTLPGRTYGSTSATLVALGPDGARYDFCPVPTDPSTWYRVTG